MSDEGQDVLRQAAGLVNGPAKDAETAAASIVTPSSYLRPHSRGQPGSIPDRTRDSVTMTPVQVEQMEGLRAIRAFLKVRTSYDVLPLSYRLIVFDTSLLVRKSLNILIQCGMSAMSSITDTTLIST